MGDKKPDANDRAGIPPGDATPEGRNIRWKTKFDDPYPWGNAQPRVDGGKVYASDMNGQGVMVKAGPAGEVVARNRGLGGGTGSPFFAASSLNPGTGSLSACGNVHQASVFVHCSE